MKQKYINKIQKNILINSSKKTTHLLEGIYKSVYKGKSTNFENLREYVLNDEIKDIDWKSSARSGQLLIKEFIAEKTHNIMLVMDTGLKMEAHTNFLEQKKDIALMIAGTIGYLSIKNNNAVGMIHHKEKKICYQPPKSNLKSLENYLKEYDNSYKESESKLNDNLKYLYKNIRKKMIIFIITDKNGINQLETNRIKKLNILYDLKIIMIEDHFLTGENLLDIEQNIHIPKLFLNDETLLQLEKKMEQNAIDKIKKQNIKIVKIAQIKEINKKLIELLKENKHGNKN